MTTTLSTRFGDITTCAAECIVNASNETGLGCFTPNHPCIDNAIHKAAGPGLLAECRLLKGIPVGVAKLTEAYSLPAKYIIHATGPKITSSGYEDHSMLAKTYYNVLELAKQCDIKEIVFCCISTGMYGFNKERSANTALSTVKLWIHQNPGTIDKIIFNTFTPEDKQIYNRLLSQISQK
jgi:O-acetyl-ADP-ribose deacetylase (regulator of RNase III)